MGCISFSAEVYTWGLGNFGNLGHGTTHSFAQPRLVDALLKQDVQQLRCGTRHSIALTAKGEVYTWGFGGDGRQRRRRSIHSRGGLGATVDQRYELRRRVGRQLAVSGRRPFLALCQRRGRSQCQHRRWRRTALRLAAGQLCPLWRLARSFRCHRRGSGSLVVVLGRWRSDFS